MEKGDLTFYVQLHLKAEHVEEWKTHLMPLIEEMAKEEAFVYCALHQDLQNETLFTLYEQWREPSVEAFVQNQMGKAYRQVYEQKLSEWLETPRNASITRGLTDWQKR